MARAAKKETPLTTEEKLAKALVPDEEQPYPVPENWCWVRLGSLYEINPKNEASDELEAGFIPMEKISAGMCTSFNFDVRPWGKAKKGHVQLTNGDVAFAKISPCFENRKSMIVSGLPNGIGAGTTEIIVLRQPSVNNRFTFWLISTDDFIQKGRRTYSGTVGQQRISMDYVRQYPIPLPPLPEQQRIVTLIESLFADLDAAKEKLQAVLDGFAERRASLLHQAFTGELTREWREENGVGLESWVRKKIEDFAFTTKLAGFEYTKNIAPNIAKEGIPLFKGKNVQQGQLVLEFESYIPKAVSDELPRSKLSRKCLLTPYVGTIGNVAIFDGSFEAHLGSNVGKIEIQEDTFEEFLLYYLRSDLGYRELTKEKKATAQESISIQAIRNVFVPIPTRPEQKEIVRILDDIFAKESHSRAAVESALAKIDTMKKAILATAFRGGFETNNSSDESAKELLRGVL